MVVCAICRKNGAYKEYTLPWIRPYAAKSSCDGKVLAKFDILTKAKITICKECQNRIADFIKTIDFEYESESEEV